MVRFIPDEIVREIADKTDIVALINEYTPVKNYGGAWKACCPFHQEKTPSFSVTPSKGLYYCFGCKAGGNVFKFLMEIEGIDFPSSVNMLAQRAGVIIPESKNMSPEQIKKSKEKSNAKDQLYEIHDEIYKKYHNQLINNPTSPVAKYLEGRGIPMHIATKFMLGIAPDSWDAVLNWGTGQGYSEKVLIDSGLVIYKEDNKKMYDRFRNRLMFPITNEQGRVVAFSARTIEKDAKGAKYVNSPETDIFKKNKILYGLSIAKKVIKDQKYVILCEGQLDVIAMYRAGYKNAVSSQGTAFGENHATILKRYTDKVYIGFDGDLAGRKATLKTIEHLLKVEIQPLVIQYPEGSDPDDLLSNGGAEAVKKCVDNALEMMAFVIQYYCDIYDKNNPFDKKKIIANIVEVLSNLKDKIVRSQYVAILAARLNVPEQEIFSELNNIRTEKENREKKQKYNKYKTPAQPIKIESHPNKQPQQLNDYIEQEEEFIDELAEQVGAINNNVVSQQAKPSANIANNSYLSKNIIDAEEKLLELALIHGTVARRVAEELPHDAISNSSIGIALEKVISMTLDDEWEFAEETLMNESAIEISLISKIISIKETILDITHDKQEKIVSECVKTILLEYIDRKISETMNHAKVATDLEIKNKYLKQYRNLGNQKRDLINKGKKK